jgi:hypothetical protein
MVDLFPFHQSETQVSVRASQGAKAQGGCCNGFHELEGTGLESDHHLKFFDVFLTEDKHCDQPLQVHECVFPSLSSAWCDKQPTSLWRLKSRLWKWLLEQHDFREISLQLIPLAMHPWSESPGAY